ncbi:466_t:CDS:2 [Ambispora gerdemannii]|uniref:466_t:CDS:1 n=1 Tax=Ambispora gerdemannii TaxID=144530 RepID=A0A9N9CUV7_9GLOM|nr:466_t:CDS:2 [Ambispora gerdemannii]
MIQVLRLLYLKGVKGTIADDDFKAILNIFNCTSQTLYLAKKKLRQLVNIGDNHIDMCVNSCLAFTGEYSANVYCTICNAPRYSTGRKAQKHAIYFPIIERLRLQFADPARVLQLLYRSNHVEDFSKLQDIYDGNLYKEMLREELLADSRDIVFSASLDGYQIFKQQRDDCWVILLINHNLPPEVRVKKENLMITAVIPGPRAPKDLNSFLRPLVDELLILETLPLRTHDIYCKRAEEYIEINSKTARKNLSINTGEIMEANRKAIPSEFGRAPINIAHHSNGFKAEEWTNWTNLYSLPLLVNYQPDESIYGKRDDKYLPAYKMVFHYLLHVETSISDCGPCWTFWQYPIERLCGILQSLFPSSTYRLYDGEENTDRELLHLRRYYQATNDFLVKELSNIGQRFSRLRTKDGYMIGSLLTITGAKSRDNSCIKYELEIANHNGIYEMKPFYGRVLYYLVHEYTNKKYMLAYVHNAYNVRQELYGLRTFKKFSAKEFINVSTIKKCVAFFKVGSLSYVLEKSEELLAD